MAGGKNSGTGRWQVVAGIAGAQMGLVSRRQLLQIGFADSSVDDAVARGQLHPVFRGVFSVGHRSITRRARLLAATIACGPGTVVSHGTAAWLLGLSDQSPTGIDVIAPVEAGRKIGGIRRRFVPVPNGPERTVRDGVPTTAVARTIVDNAGVLASQELGKLIEQAAVLGALDAGAIDAILDGPPRRGARKLLRQLEPWRRYKRGIHVRSRMEAKLLPLLTGWGLPVPETNARLVLAGKRFEIDFLWRRQKLAVETDGGAFHDNPLAGARDSERNCTLTGAGYLVARLGWEELRDRSEETMAELARLLCTPR